MDIYEAAVAEYLCAWGRTFIAPQFDVKFDPVHKLGGSAPDFVALDFTNRQVLVVEVSSGYNLGVLIGRVRDRENRWYRPIGQYLVETRVVDSEWRIRTVVFIREEWTRKGNSWAEGQVEQAADVTFLGLEQVMLPYKWHEERLRVGIPGQHGATTIPVAPLT